MKQLEEIKARASAATVGPWKFDCDKWLEGAARDGEFVLSPGPYDTDEVQLIEMRPADEEFIAAARTDVPKLVAALEAVEDVLTWLDAIQSTDTTKRVATGSHVHAGPVASIIRDAIAEALEAA